jgi:hypothetical protein
MPILAGILDAGRFRYVGWPKLATFEGLRTKMTWAALRFVFEG